MEKRGYIHPDWTPEAADAHASALPPKVAAFSDGDDSQQQDDRDVDLCGDDLPSRLSRTMEGALRPTSR